MIKNILFDMDDTLIKTMDVFNKYNVEIAEIVKGVTNENEASIIEAFNKVDLKNVAVFGLTPERYELSWKEYVRSLSEDIKVCEEVSKKIEKKVKEMFEQPIVKIDGVDEMLQGLKDKGYCLVLVTSGDLKTQQEKIIKADFKKYFERIYIPQQKNVETYRDVVEDLHLDLNETIMVGNSLSSDIRPALEVGMKAVHVDVETWGYDNAEVEGIYFVVPEVTVLTQILDKDTFV